MAEIRGRILEIHPTENIQTKDGKFFQKRTLVLDASIYNQHTGERVVNTPALEFSSSRCGILDNYKVGDLVKVSYNLRGRRVTNADGSYRYMTNVNAYAVEYVQQNRQMNNQAPQLASPQQPNHGYNGYNQTPQQGQYQTQQGQYHQNQQLDLHR